MRPVRLEVEGFTCYRERQPALTFDGLSLFAIAGPTGAGKSSILDAILFALYGQVPRIGKQGFVECISQGRDALAVTLDFTVRGTTYRVARRVKRTKSGLSSSAVLEELAPTARPLKEQIRPVNDEIVRLLGLDFDAFTQTVILPQGEFAKFLKADPKDQRGILQHLLRHEIFERMREEAERRRREADQAVQVLERALAASEHATPEALARERTRLGACTGDLARLATLKDAHEQALAGLRSRRQLTLEVQGLRARRMQLESAAPVVDAKREAVRAARAAAVVVPRVDAARDATTRLTQLTRARVEAEATATARREEVSRAEGLLARATADAAATDGLNRRIRALDEIKGDVERRDGLLRSVEASRRAVPALRQRTKAADAALADAQRVQAEAEAARAAAQAALTACVFDPGEEQRLHDVWDTAVRLRATLDEEATLAARQAEADTAVASADRAMADADKAVKGAAREVATATAVERDAAQARDDGRTRHQAVAVREHLHIGDACPVCLQTVVLLPPQERVPELEALDRQFEEAKRRLADVVRAQQAAAERRASADARLQAAQQAQRLLEEARREKATARAGAAAAIAGALAGAHAGGELEDARALIAAVERQRSVLRATRQASDQARERVRTSDAARAAADLAFAQAQAAATSAAEALERLIAEGTRLKGELDEATARIAAVSSHANPAVERDDLARQVTALDSARREAETALGTAQSALASAQASFEAAVAAHTHAADATASTQQALAEALDAGGFASVEAVTLAVRSAVQQAALDDEIRRHDAEQAAVTARLLELEPQVVGQEVAADALSAAETACQETLAAWRAADVEVATLTATITRLEADVERRHADQRELAQASDSRAVLTGMAGDLRSSAFQEYLLEEAFRALVTGASVRMRAMSNRYALDWREGAFYVVDHDNAGEQRRAETLSGGETFMASLCLALQLSDEVLKTSGALQMDSLFIDEGFGTLDADALAEVTDAMEALRQDGGRLIGVISHRPELTERLPGCIRVSKGAGESTWALERVG